MSVSNKKIDFIPDSGKLALGKVYKLSRGGFIVLTSEGYVQVGVPPEAIKDTMDVLGDIPQIYCLPKVFFNRDKGITLAEVEFPIYYNFFLKNRKTIVVCSDEKKSDMNRIVRSALFGPEVYNISDDFLRPDESNIPSIQKETAFFTHHSVNDLVDFRAISNNDGVKVGQITIEVNNSEYVITDKKNEFTVVVPFVVEYLEGCKLPMSSKKKFSPPYFGSTCLGASNGFDPLDSTSGFVFWIANRGIMVDPPANSTEMLFRANVSPRLIKDVILTHTHADHDAGLFQKILSDEKVNVYTTKTVMNSWLNKYSRMSGISVEKIKSFFNYKPVHIDEDVNINGAIFNFSYSLHSIPTLGFRFKFKGKKVVYSGDHLNDPKEYNILYEKGFLSEERRAEFKKFPWNSDIIFHEAGYPPLHTPVEYLDNLAEKVKKKTYIYHIAKKDLPKNTSLRRAETGVKHTLTYDFDKSKLPSVAEQIFDKLEENSWFKNLNANKKRFIDYFSGKQLKTYKAGESIVKKINKNQLTYVLEGVVAEAVSHKEWTRKYSAYQWMGRSNSMKLHSKSGFIAFTDVMVIDIKTEDFFSFLTDGNVVIDEFLNLVSVDYVQERNEMLSAVPFFKLLSLEQKIEFESLLEPVKVDKATVLVEKDKTLSDFYFYYSGMVNEKTNLSNLVKSYRSSLKKKKVEKTIKTLGEALFFKVNLKRLEKFLSLNPGVYIRYFDF